MLVVVVQIKLKSLITISAVSVKRFVSICSKAGVRLPKLVCYRRLKFLEKKKFFNNNKIFREVGLGISQITEFVLYPYNKYPDPVGISKPQQLY